MADAPVVPEVPVAPVAVAPAAPDVAAVVEAPVAPVAVAPVVEAPVISAPVAPVAEAPAAPVVPTHEPTAIELAVQAAAAKKAEAAKPPEAPKAPEAPKVDGAVEAAPEAPVVEASTVPAIEWKLEIPETLKIDELVMKEFTGTLNQLITPKDPAERAAAGQKLIAMHEKAMQDYAVQSTKNQFEVFNKTKTDKLAEAMADPEFGGNRWQNTIDEAVQARNAFISSHKEGSPAYNADAAEFDEMCRITGCGSWPAFIKFMARVDQGYRKPTVLPPANPQPPKDIAKRPGGSRSLYAQKEN